MLHSSFDCLLTLSSISVRLPDSLKSQIAAFLPAVCCVLKGIYPFVSSTSLRYFLNPHFFSGMLSLPCGETSKSRRSIDSLRTHCLFHLANSRGRLKRQNLTVRRHQNKRNGNALSFMFFRQREKTKIALVQ
uniref:Uncharacterized protein n=1 Tax=Molossus molossus TaxID=27622 RepID=A0A7J8DQ49_MOLMO|nr:hypothetical protein HJG59_009263 [Molossus molossus]